MKECFVWVKVRVWIRVVRTSTRTRTRDYHVSYIIFFIAGARSSFKSYFESSFQFWLQKSVRCLLVHAVRFFSSFTEVVEPTSKAEELSLPLRKPRKPRQPTTNSWGGQRRRRGIAFGKRGTNPRRRSRRLVVPTRARPLLASGSLRRRDDRPTHPGWIGITTCCCVG